MSLVLNSLPRSWAVFKAIQKGRTSLPTYGELEGLLLEEDVSRIIEKNKDEEEEIMFMRGNTRGSRGTYRGRSLRGG